MDSNSHRAKILVVDDEERNLRLLKALLVPFGYEVFEAGDGRGSIELAKKLSPDLILLDIMMPDMDGFEVTRRLKKDEWTKSIPIIIVTALQNVDDKVKALELGADDFLSKPIQNIELQARVKSLLKVKAYYDHMKFYNERLEAEVNIKTYQLKSALENLKKASLDTVLRLSRAAEYKDEETAGHIRRVSHFAAALAHQLGFHSDGIEEIRYAAPLHDIGKIGVPEQILLKSGKLDDDEWEIMKLHTVMGSQILADSETAFLRTAESIALTHHERWDGSGYPQGLRGEEIPLEGRITAVADVFDALTSRRPYRGPLPLDKALRMIDEASGTHFDPECVKAFFSIKAEILNISQSIRDETPAKLVELMSRMNPGSLYAVVGSTQKKPSGEIVDRGK